MEQQIISNLPRHLLDIPAFFAVKPNKVPKVNDWGNSKNQKSYKDVRGLMGFDITKADILVFDFDNALDKDGNWRNDKVKSTFERIMQLNPYSEISISNKGIHIAVKPTKGKFDKITNAGANVLYFDDDHKAKDCPKLEIFYGSKARYILFTGKVFHCKPNTPIPEGELVDLLVAKILDEIHLANKNSAYLVRTEENQKGKVASTLGATYQKPKRDGFMTTNEVAAKLHVTRHAVEKWRNEGKFLEDIKDHKGVYWYSIERVEQLESVYRTNDKDPADNISAAHMKHYSDNDDDNCFSELDNIKDALKYIPADLPYQDWLNVLMAAHSFDSSPSMMFIMDEWSKTAPNVYKDGDVAYKWQSFNPSDGITIATLFDYAKKFGYVYKHKSTKKDYSNARSDNQIINAPDSDSNSNNDKVYKPPQVVNDDDDIQKVKIELALMKRTAPEKLTDDAIELFLRSDFTDFDDADIFVDTYGEILKYNHDTVAWLQWTDNNHWKEIQNTLLIEKWRAIATRAKLQAKLNYCNAQLDFNITKKNMSQKQIENAISELKQLKSLCDKTIHLENNYKTACAFKMAAGLHQVSTFDKDYNSNKYSYNTLNRIIDFKSLEEKPNDPAELHTLVANVKYNPAAACPEWEQFLESAIPNYQTRIYLQKFCGYSLLGTNEENVFLFLYGEGGTGKGTFVEAITRPMGDYTKTFPIELLTENRKETTGEEPTPQLYKMRHCRLITTSETKKNRKFDTMKLKAWTGDDVLTARNLNKPPIDFKPQFKILISGNFRPKIEDITDEGVKRRLRIVPFNSKPKHKNTKLKEIFETEEAKSAIFNWLLAGCIMYLNDKKNGIDPFDVENSPEEVQTALQQYYEANDNISPFVSDKGFYFHHSLSMPAKDIWIAYLNWCKENNERNLKRNDFMNMFLRRFKDEVIFSSHEENQKRDMVIGIGVEKTLENQ